VTEEETVYATRVPAVLEQTISEVQTLRKVDSSTTRYINPSYSGSNRGSDRDSNRDTDRDGVIDKYDRDPYDASIQTESDYQERRAQERRGGASGGRTNSRIICTWLTANGLMDKEDLTIDQQFTIEKISMTTRIGYWVWAYPLVDWMEKNKEHKFVNIIRYLAQARANEIKYQKGYSNKPDYVGKTVRFFGENLCTLIGHVINVKEKLFKKGIN